MYMYVHISHSEAQQWHACTTQTAGTGCALCFDFQVRYAYANVSSEHTVHNQVAPATGAGVVGKAIASVENAPRLHLIVLKHAVEHLDREATCNHHHRTQ